MKVKHRKVKVKRMPEIRGGVQNEDSQREGATAPLMERAGSKKDENFSAGGYPPSDEDRTVDMTGWENEELSDMSDLFFIVKGQCGKKKPTLTVRNGSDYYEVNVGSYDPDDGETVEHYCVMDRITFNCTYGGGSLEAALDNIRRTVVRYRNDPERYFKAVADATNEDYYARHYLNEPPFSEAELKKRAEDGRSWRVGKIMKSHHYAVMTMYAHVYGEMVGASFRQALADLENLALQRTKARRSIHKKRAALMRKAKRK